MVCFTIAFAQPVIHQPRKKITQDMRIQHICKHTNAEILSRAVLEGVEYFEMAVCDNEAIDLLRDMPEPITCLSIKFHKKDIALYKNYKILKEECVPPTNSYLKRVYWTASQLESRYSHWSS